MLKFGKKMQINKCENDKAWVLVFEESRLVGIVKTNDIIMSKLIMVGVVKG